MYGGDAMRYWELTAKIPEGSGWLAHWGTRTDFIQFLNYIPSKTLGLPFLVGNLLYGLLSLAALAILWQLVWKHFPKPANTLTHYLLISLFFFPNLHFWTAGVGKEAIAFFGLTLFVLGCQHLNKYALASIAGIVISFLIKPQQGWILLAVLLPLLAYSPHLSKKPKLTYLAVGAAALALCTVYIWQITGIRGLDVSSYTGEQMEFLDTFQAGSTIPMDSYSWPVKLFSFYLRPFWEGSSVYYVFASVENILIALALLGSGLLFWTKEKMPVFVLMGLASLLIISIIYILTLNNLGIIMRMKSIYIPFLYFSGWLGINSAWKAYTCKL